MKWSEVAQSCPTLCNPMDCSPPGSSVHGIFQAWVLEWVAISFSRGSSRPRDQTQVSCIVGRHFTVWATREATVADSEALIDFSRTACGCGTVYLQASIVLARWLLSREAVLTLKVLSKMFMDSRISRKACSCLFVCEIVLLLTHPKPPFSLYKG